MNAPKSGRGEGTAGRRARVKGVQPKTLSGISMSREELAREFNKSITRLSGGDIYSPVESREAHIQALVAGTHLDTPETHERIEYAKKDGLARTRNAIINAVSAGRLDENYAREHLEAIFGEPIGEHEFAAAVRAGRRLHLSSEISKLESVAFGLFPAPDRLYIEARLKATGLPPERISHDQALHNLRNLRASHANISNLLASSGLPREEQDVFKGRLNSIMDEVEQREAALKPPRKTTQK